MRSDMKRIIGDRKGSRRAGPRKGKRFSPAEFRSTGWEADDAPLVGGLVGQGLEKSLIGRRRWRGGYNAKPLMRYISSQVGRPWDDVLSDISAVLRGADIAEARWPRLLSSWVAVKGEVVAGVIVVSSWYGRMVPLDHPYGPRFYVDPRDGRLARNTSIETHRMRRTRLAAEQAAERATRMRVLSPTRQLHLLADGNWWEVTLSEVARQVDVEDVVLRAGLAAGPGDWLYGRPGVYASAKRPLSAREIKRHRLR